MIVAEFVLEHERDTENFDIFAVGLLKITADSFLSVNMVFSVLKIFKYRYIDGAQNKVMPWQKISIKLNMSIQGCINIHNSALEYFKNKLNKEINNVE